MIERENNQVVSFFVAGLFYLYMGHLLGITIGLFHHKVGVYTLFYFAAVPFLLRCVSLPTSASLRRCLYFLLSVGQLIFIHTMIKDPHVIYPSDLKIEGYIKGLLSVTQSLSVFMALVLGGSILIQPGSKFKNALGFASENAGTELAEKTLGVLYKGLALTSIILLLFIQFLVPVLSPHPWVDVFINNTAAVDFFLSGKNPYSQTYVDIYKGMFAYAPGFLYFPGLLFFLAPFKAIFGDIRYCFIFAQIFNVALIYRIAKRRETPAGGGGFLSWLLPVLWLSFPVTYHVLEQSWTDTLLVLFTFLIVDSIDLRRWAWVGILSGLVFTTKQYGFVISIFAILRVTQVGGWNQAIRCAGLAAAAFSAVLIPFMVVNFKGFYAMTIQAQVGPGIRTDSLGMSAWLFHRWGYHLPGAVQAFISILGIGGGTWMILSDPLKKTDRLAIALFFAYGCSFLFGKWAFCNYHYLLASFLILYLATELERLGSSVSS